MKAPIIYDDYLEDISNNGKKKRWVKIFLIDEDYKPNKKDKHSKIDNEIILEGRPFEINDEESIDNYRGLITTLLMDALIEESDNKKNKIKKKVKEKKYKNLMTEIVSSKINSLKMVSKFKKNGAKYMVLEDINGIIIQCEEIPDYE